MAPTGHSKLSPSGASFWMNCPGGPALLASLDLPEDRSSQFAAEGSAAHLIREICLQFGFDAYDFVGTRVTADGFVFECDDDMAGHLQPGIDRIREFPVEEELNEGWVNLSNWTGFDDHGKPQGGTVDWCGWWFERKTNTFWIVTSDLKYGMGVPVQAVRNKQQQIYDLGVWDIIKTRVPEGAEVKFRIIIDQPRNSGGGGEWVISLEELLAFGKEVRAAAAETRNPDAPCVPGADQCFWCAAAKIDNACIPHEKWKLDFLGLDFEDLDAEEPPELPDRELLTKDRRRYINANASFIRKWLDRLHADEIEEVLEKGELCGVKAVEGRAAKRTHTDEDQSESYLRKRGLSDDKIFTKKLISVAQLDKLLGKGVFPRSLVSQGDPKPVLVPVEDDRPAIIRRSEFEDLGDETDDLLA